MDQMDQACRANLHIGWIGVLCCLLPVNLLGQADQSEYISAAIVCTNQEIQSDVVFVTSHAQPIEFRCDLEDRIPVPDGYRKALPQWEWHVESGTLTGNGFRTAWKNLEPGLQTIRVSGKVVLTSTESGGFFSGKKEDITFTFEAEKECLVPVYVSDLSSGRVNGFKVGKYPDPHDPADLAKTASAATVKKHAEVYQPPSLFYEVSPDTFYKKIYRDYELREFDLDPRFSPLTYPRYIALSPLLLKKMGLLEDVMRDHGVELSKFQIIYGYRSPAYNLGEWEQAGEDSLKSPFSMHMYGKAVDFIVDEDDDFVIDDLNQDGRIDIEDAKAFREYIRKLDIRFRDQNNPMVGAGIIYYHHDYYERGEYAQTPYVHMDTRGYVRDNGTLIYLETGKKDNVDLESPRPYRLKRAVPDFPFQRMFFHLGWQ